MLGYLLTEMLPPVLRATQPCILREVVDRPNLGHQRPPRSMGHYNNLHDRLTKNGSLKLI
jgi:hypothetical protein